MKTQKRKKSLKYLISLSSIDYDEFIVRAKSKKEAHKKAEERMIKEYGDYIGWEINTITEAK